MDLLAWFRRPPAAAGPAPAPVVRRPEWPRVPPVQRVVEPPSLITDPGGFRAGLSTWADPSLHGPPGHLVSATAPSGLGHGLASPVPAGREPAPRPKPVVQRRPAAVVRESRLVSAVDAPVPPPARLPAIPLQRTVTDASPAEADPATTDDAPDPAEAEPVGPADVAGTAPEVPPLGVETLLTAGGHVQREPDPPPVPRRIGLGAPVQRLPESARPAPPPPSAQATGGSAVPASRASAPRIGPPVSRVQAGPVQRAADGPHPGPPDPPAAGGPASSPPVPPVDREVAGISPIRPADAAQPVQRTLGAADLDGRDGRPAPGGAGGPVQRMPTSQGAPADGGLDTGRRWAAVPARPPGGGSVQRDGGDPVERTDPVPRNGGGRTGGVPDVGAEPLVPPAVAEPVQRTLGARPVDDRLGGAVSRDALPQVQRDIGEPVPAAWPGPAVGGGGLDTGRRWGAVPARPPGDLPGRADTRDPVQRAVVAPLVPERAGQGSPPWRFGATDAGGPPAPAVQRSPSVFLPAQEADVIPAATQLVVARFPESAGSVAREPVTAGAGLIGDRPITPAPPAVPAPAAPPGTGTAAERPVPDLPPPPVVSRIVGPEPSATIEHTPAAEVAEPVVVSRAADAEPSAGPAAAEPVAEPVAAAPVAPGSPGAPAAPGGSTSATEVDALVGRIYDPLVRRLKAELRLERERAGHVLDLRL